ncbi:GNAT family N-acetyltransferase [Periweissella ghanensis]|uniref:N-acetyltransferase domain-containing protein n=1 Tax=Periweissella ghanensis TaxID=467997 RepID=A0ABM8ZCE6_9LACO|nr:GNAT family N-acetyltransferase [Periweissella ghanensis]MCM0600075.1 GNAT family N-acetyltransferase [Periweissella ghanensis]CAH0418967.1 hypothetical protein WGH24286_01410 [Periweissella ghanensis]
MIRLRRAEDRQQLECIYLTSRQSSPVFAAEHSGKLGDFANDTVDELVLVATDGENLQGFISIYQPTRFIHLLFVAPSFQRQGIGQQLVAAALATAAGDFELKCLSQNQTALTFYEQLGWQKIHENTADKPYWVLRYYQNN